MTRNAVRFVMLDSHAPPRFSTSRSQSRRGPKANLPGEYVGHVDPLNRRGRLVERESARRIDIAHGRQFTAHQLIQQELQVHTFDVVNDSIFKEA